MNSPIVRVEHNNLHALWYGGLTVNVYNMYTGKEIDCFTLPDKQVNAYKRGYKASEVVAKIKTYFKG